VADPATDKPKTLKVLHVHSGNMIGGVETVLLTFAEFAHTCPEFQQEFALAFDGAFAEALRASGATVHILPEAQLRHPFSVLRSRRQLRQIIVERNIQAVISHSPWCQVVYAPVPRKLKVSLIFWMHNNFDGHWLQRLASRNAPDLAICNSAFTRSTLPDVYPYSPSRIIYNPVRPLPTAGPDRSMLREQLGAPPSSVVILMASRTEAWKGHMNLLRAAAQIQTAHAWSIWIAGAPQTEAEKTYFASVQAEAERLELSGRIRFLGQRSDVPALMRAADIYCQPNAEPEPFGVVFVEALQAGVPIVTFRMGGAQEILEQESGILVPPGDIQGLQKALVRLIEDESLRKKLGSLGPERAKVLCDPAQQIRRVYEIVTPVQSRY
jgi:glycosyltransferase involved in cell wall biosynthesis